MERVKALLRRRSSYEPLEDGSQSRDGERTDQPKSQIFSWIDYSVFFLLGVAMLWAW
jgi:equilibrative nucleoside transporter 1/2/3